MTATKVTLLFQAGTVDASGNAARIGGFSESYYSTLPLDSAALQTQWQALCLARAALLPSNARIVGSRYQQVDPVGGSRQYDNVYTGAVIQNDLPSMALQWTVRSANSPNQRSLILRAVPDARVVTGEYSPIAGYNLALQNFFAELRNKWQFRAIDRTILPVKIVQIVAGVMTTATPHGLAASDVVNIMSTKVGTDRVVTSYHAGVLNAPTATTATLYPLDRRDSIPDSVSGRARKASIIYPFFSITNEEIIAPNAITRKVGAPFRKFRGRRTAAH